MDRQLIAAIFKDIVISYPYCRCFPLDGFAFPDSLPDWQSATLGLNYLDYEQGRFWSRGWIDKGANPDDQKFEYAGIILEQKDWISDRLDMKSGTYVFYLVSIDRIGCPQCPDDCDRTKGRIRNELFHIHRWILNQFFASAEFEYYIDGQKFVTWSTVEKMEKLQAAGKLTSFQATGDDIESMVDPGDLPKIVTWGEGLNESFLAFASELRINVCFDAFNLCMDPDAVPDPSIESLPGDGTEQAGFGLLTYLDYSGTEITITSKYFPEDLSNVYVYRGLSDTVERVDPGDLSFDAGSGILTITPEAVNENVYIFYWRDDLDLSAPSTLPAGDLESLPAALQAFGLDIQFQEFSSVTASNVVVSDPDFSKAQTNYVLVYRGLTTFRLIPVDGRDISGNVITPNVPFVSENVRVYWFYV